MTMEAETHTPSNGRQGSAATLYNYIKHWFPVLLSLILQILDSNLPQYNNRTCITPLRSDDGRYSYHSLLASLLQHSASSVDSSKGAHGFCKQLDIPVFVTSESAVYDIPRVDNYIESTAWAI